MKMSVYGRKQRSNRQFWHFPIIGRTGGTAAVHKIGSGKDEAVKSSERTAMVQVGILEKVR